MMIFVWCFMKVLESEFDVLILPNQMVVSPLLSRVFAWAESKTDTAASVTASPPSTDASKVTALSTVRLDTLHCLLAEESSLGFRLLSYCLASPATSAPSPALATSSMESTSELPPQTLYQQFLTHNSHISRSVLVFTSDSKKQFMAPFNPLSTKRLTPKQKLVRDLLV